jgi:hypothetical protein
VTRKCGESLVEVVIAVAIVSIACAALLGGTLAAARRFGPDVARSALDRTAQREMRIALDLMKYQGNAIAPTTVATTIPMPGASPAPAHVSISTVVLAGGAVTLAIRASLDARSTDAVTLTTTVPPGVPLPSSTFVVNGGAPQ